MLTCLSLSVSSLGEDREEAEGREAVALEFVECSEGAGLITGPAPAGGGLEIVLGGETVDAGLAAAWNFAALARSRALLVADLLLTLPGCGKFTWQC